MDCDVITIQPPSLLIMTAPWSLVNEADALWCYHSEAAESSLGHQWAFKYNSNSSCISSQPFIQTDKAVSNKFKLVFHSCYLSILLSILFTQVLQSREIIALVVWLSLSTLSQLNIFWAWRSALTMERLGLSTDYHYQSKLFIFVSVIKRSWGKNHSAIYQFRSRNSI